MSDLKPCPFCGGAAHTGVDDWGQIYGGCDDLECVGSEIIGSEESALQWNTCTTPTVQEAAKVVLDEPNALAELAKALIFWDHLTSFQRLRVGLHYTIDPTGKTVPKRYLASISEEPQ